MDIRSTDTAVVETVSISALSPHALAALLKPMALMAAVLGFWGFAAEFNWTGAFAIPSGLFSHWQIWLGAAGVLQLCSYKLDR